MTYPANDSCTHAESLRQPEADVAIRRDHGRHHPAGVKEKPGNSPESLCRTRAFAQTGKRPTDQVSWLGGIESGEGVAEVDVVPAEGDSPRHPERQQARPQAFFEGESVAKVCRQ